MFLVLNFITMYLTIQALDAIVILVRLFVQQNDATTQSENVSGIIHKQ